MATSICEDTNGKFYLLLLLNLMVLFSNFGVFEVSCTTY